MKEKIKSTTEENRKNKDKPVEYILEDKDFLLIRAINDLTSELRMLRAKI